MFQFGNSSIIRRYTLCPAKHPHPTTLPALLDAWRGWSHLCNLGKGTGLGVGWVSVMGWSWNPLWIGFWNPYCHWTPVNFTVNRKAEFMIFSPRSSTTGLNTANGWMRIHVLVTYWKSFGSQDWTVAGPGNGWDFSAARQCIDLGMYQLSTAVLHPLQQYGTFLKWW